MPSPDHMLTVWIIVCVALIAGLITAAILATIQLNQGGAYLSRHGRRRRARRSLPHEMRHHRTATGTWARTRGARAARLSGEDTVVLDQAAPHTLSGRDEAGQRWTVANLLDDTSADGVTLDALLGRRPAELAGAAA